MVAASEHIALAPIAPDTLPLVPCAVSILPQFFDRARATTAPEQRDAPHPKSRRPVLSSRAAPTELLSSLAHLTTVAGRALPSGGYFGRQTEIEVRSPESTRLRERLFAFRATILRRPRTVIPNEPSSPASSRPSVPTRRRACGGATTRAGAWRPASALICGYWS